MPEAVELEFCLPLWQLFRYNPSPSERSIRNHSRKVKIQSVLFGRPFSSASRCLRPAEDLWSQEGVPSRASLECQAEDSDAQAEPTAQSTDKNIAPTVESDPPGHWLYSFQLTNPQTPLVVEAHSAPAEYLEWALRQTVTRHNGLHTEFTVAVRVISNTVSFR
jgi:hypothetical protein